MSPRSKQMGRPRKIPAPGTRFGHWTVTGEPYEIVARNTAVWCICDCGQRRLWRAAGVRSGKSSMCRGCRNREQAARNQIRYGLERAEIRARREAGETLQQIADRFGVSRQAIWDRLRKMAT